MDYQRSGLTNIIRDLGRTLHGHCCRQAGGVEPLVSLLQGAQDKRAIKNASWALANLAKSNSDNKAAIREAKGIQVLHQLLCLALCLSPLPSALLTI